MTVVIVMLNDYYVDDDDGIESLTNYVINHGDDRSETHKFCWPEQARLSE